MESNTPPIVDVSLSSNLRAALVFPIIHAPYWGDSPVAVNPPPKKIVIIDDDRNILATLEALLRRRGFDPYVAPNGSQGRKRIAEVKPDLALLDIGLPDVNGLDLLEELRAEYPELPFIVLTANDTLENAINAIKRGAFHFFSKPYVVEELLSLASRAMEQADLTKETLSLRIEKKKLEQDLQETRELLEPVFASRKMKVVDALISRVAPTTANVMLTGESGVGKEVIASRLHAQSLRKTGPMVRLNCGAFPANMIESELFGYAKGAFTGAVASFPGMIAEASGGTLFLDEVTEMPVNLQTRFLRVLQEREYRPLGSTKTLPADFRLIAATNRDPKHAVMEGKLRKDLYFRLKTFEIEIPPLRERLDELPRLADLFLRRFAIQNQRPIPVVEPDAMQLLLAYNWPGNVRELQNAMEHACILSECSIVKCAHLPKEVRLPQYHEDLPETPDAFSAFAPHVSETTLVETEKRAISDALRKSDGNKKKAAEILGIHRPTLYAKMKRLGLR